MANTYVNKVQLADGTSLIDISDTTATASDVLNSKYFYTASGQKVQGTGVAGSVTQDQDGYIVLPATGGGTPSVSGLVYETGTWTPSEDVASYTIPFTNTHTTAPFYYMVTDATGSYSSTTKTAYSCTYFCYGQLTGAPQYTSDGDELWGWIFKTAVSSDISTFWYDYNQLLYSYNSSPSNADYPRDWATETGIKAFLTTSIYWRAGRTYKWIAVWAPTT